MSTPFLEVSLSAGYGTTQTLNEVAFQVESGARTGVAGVSGSGKSTLVLALMGMLRWRNGWTRGHVRLQGRDLLQCSERELRRVRGREIALVPQSPLTALNPALTLQTHFAEVWRAHASGEAELAERRRTLLSRVELPYDETFLRRRPAEISIGQAQRVLIALALLHRPSLLIADEPTSALDVCTQQEIVRLLQDVNRVEGTTLLYVSHDLVSVLQLCERMLVVSRGSLVDSLDLSAGEVRSPHAITRNLLATLPAPASVIRQTFRSQWMQAEPSFA